MVMDIGGDLPVSVALVWRNFRLSGHTLGTPPIRDVTSNSYMLWALSLRSTGGEPRDPSYPRHERLPWNPSYPRCKRRPRTGSDVC